jgi:hypothetical protein
MSLEDMTLDERNVQTARHILDKLNLGKTKEEKMADDTDSEYEKEKKDFNITREAIKYILFDLKAEIKKMSERIDKLENLL